jgi:hypothetical protein
MLPLSSTTPAFPFFEAAELRFRFYAEVFHSSFFEAGFFSDDAACWRHVFAIDAAAAAEAPR